jgi:PAS domain S-box-containing protein/putative nucleotidyltransferase with HDIG domain
MSKVLAVDNDTFILEFIKDILTNEGHEVMTAEDGLSAVDILANYVPDIVFVDLVMPNIDGKRLCKIIRGMRKLEKVFLVILSATVLEEKIDADALGVDICIAKGPLNEMAQNILSALNLIEAAAPPPLSSPLLGGENSLPRAITGELISFKRHFEAIFEKIYEGILEVTKNRRIIYANPAALSIIGLQEEKLLASSFTDLFSEDYRQTVTRLIETAYKGSIRITEDPLISLNEHLLTVKAFPVDDDASTAVIILNDVTKQKEAEKTLSKSVKKLQKALNGTIQAITMIAERRDPYTAGHQKRVADFAQAISREMGLSEDQIEGIRLSGLVHDVGKMAVPAEILSKPGILDDEEFALIKKHPRVGYDILKGIEFPWPIAEIVLQHHERMNGSGYPRGLSGEEILIEARILCVSDVVEAMVSHRPYRPALSLSKVLEKFNQEKGELYDPEVVRACLKLLEEKNYRFK